MKITSAHPVINRRNFLSRSILLSAGLSLGSISQLVSAQNQFLTSIAIGDFKLFYEDHGSGPAVIFAHGAAGTHASWWQQVPVLSKSYRCVTYDQRGHGFSVDSPEGPYSSAFVEDLRELMDALEIEKASLVAQSMGGRSCLGFAAKYPERVETLVMGDTTGGYTDPELQALRAEFSGVRAAFAPEFAIQHPELAFLYREVSNSSLPSARNSVNVPMPDIQAIIDAEIPVLFIVGEKDTLAPPQVIEAMHRKMPGSKFVLVPGSGHSVYFEKAEIFNQLLLDFFAEHV